MEEKKGGTLKIFIFLFVLLRELGKGKVETFEWKSIKNYNHKLRNWS